MNTAEALKFEIERTPEPMLQEVYDFLLFLKSRVNGSISPDVSTKSEAASVEPPDFLARQKAIFGDRIVPDSQELLDLMRADRI